jgi:hypothetical protein
VLPTPASCANGGPSPSVTLGSQTVCADALGSTTFLLWATCSCGGLQADANNVAIDAYDSTKGPYEGPSTPGGDVGVNGAVNVNNPMSVSGSLSVGGTNPIVTRALTVGTDLHVASAIVNPGPVTIAGDAFVGAGIETSDPFKITGALHQPAGAQNSASVTYGSLAPGPVSVTPPCACGGSDVLPIAALVTQHQTMNDDNAVGLNPDVLSNLNAPARLDLPCGSFYLSEIEDNAPVVIYVHGRVALYVGGNVGVRQTAFALDPDAEIDVFVAGDLDVDAATALGSPNYPALARLFVAGKVGINAPVTISGFLYAPNAKYDLNDTTTVYGGLFVGDFGGRDVLVHYDRALRNPSPSCSSAP